MTSMSLMDRLQAWGALLPLLVLLAGTYWLTLQVAPLPAVPDYKARHDPDIILENFAAQALGKNGLPRFSLVAQKMMHYPDDDSTHLQMPSLVYTAPLRPAVHISADNGEVSRNGDDIFLRNNVQIVRDATATQSEMEIATSYLHVAPDDERADTDQPLVLKDANGTVNAVGMQLDNRARALKLLAQVKAQYELAH